MELDLCETLINYHFLVSPSGFAGFFFITFSTLFLRASLSLLNLFYFHVQSINFASNPCLAKHDSKRPIMYLQSGSYSNFKALQYSMNSQNSDGQPSHNSYKVVSIFFFLILLYFSFLLLPGRPYHGKLPLSRYNNTWPMVSRSSLRDYSIPLCVFILA